MTWNKFLHTNLNIVYNCSQLLRSVFCTFFCFHSPPYILSICINPNSLSPLLNLTQNLLKHYSGTELRVKCFIVYLFATQHPFLHFFCHSLWSFTLFPKVMLIFVLFRYCMGRSSNTGMRSYAYAHDNEEVGLQTVARPLGETEGRGCWNGRSGWCEDRKRKRRRKQVAGDNWPRRRGPMKRADQMARCLSSEEAAGSG